MGWHDAFREAFPQLQDLEERGEVYLDNAATTLKPRVMIDRLAQFYTRENANIHRGIYRLSWEASEAYEQAKKRILTVFGLSHRTHTLITTRNATESLNLAAHLSKELITREGSMPSVTLSITEHHSNLLPWRERMQTRVKPFTSDGLLDGTPDTPIISITGMTNTTGHTPHLIRIFREWEEKIRVLDAAQQASMLRLPREADMISLSAHKVYGPLGLGLLIIRRNMLDRLLEADVPPLTPGGGTVRDVHANAHAYAGDEHRYEGGTPPIGELIAFADTLDWLERYRERLHQHEARLARMIEDEAEALPRGVRVLDLPWPRVKGILSLWHEKLPSHDLAHLLSREGIAVRAGWHCAQPFHEHSQAKPTVRVSTAAYTREEDLQRFFTAYKRLVKRYA